MEKREAKVLFGLVTEYIRSGKPVGSELLSEHVNLDVSPATIRNILSVLEAEGYIEKPHTSAGRIPTDKGYRAYVNSLVAKDIAGRQQQKIASRFDALTAIHGRPSRAAAKLLSELSHCLAISGWMSAHDIQEAGLTQILDQENDEQQVAVREIAFLLEHVDNYLRQLSAQYAADKGSAIYIGSENPLFDAVYTSSLVRTMPLPSGETVVLMMVGPKRMPYQRNMALLNSVASILKDHV